MDSIDLCLFFLFKVSTTYGSVITFCTSFIIYLIAIVYYIVIDIEELNFNI